MMKKFFIILGKILAWIVLSVIVLVTGLALTLQLPSVQTYITGKATQFISKKTNTKVELRRVEISFPKAIVLKNIFLEDTKHDTLLSAGYLRIDIDLLGLLKKQIVVSEVELTDLTSSVYRAKNSKDFNFQFIINAFADTAAATPKKDTVATEPWKIKVDEILLNNIKLSFRDSLGGNLFYCRLQKLHTEINEFDLEKSVIDISDLELSKVDSYFDITMPPKPSDPLDTAAVPFNIKLKNMEFNQVNFRYGNKPESQNIVAQLGKTWLRNGAIDLSKQEVKIGRFELFYSKIAIEMVQADAKKPPVKVYTVKNDIKVAVKPGFKVDVTQLFLNKNSFKMDFVNAPVADKGIDFNHLQLNDIKIKGQNIHYEEDNIYASLKELAVNEKSGVVLRHLGADIKMDAKHAELKNLLLVTKHSKISKHLAIYYSSLASLGDTSKLGDLGVTADLERSYINMHDILQFQPELLKTEIIAFNKNRVIHIDTKISGKLKSLSVNNLAVSTGNYTSLNVNGNISGLPNINKTIFDLNIPLVHTTRKDLETFFPSTMLSSVRVPDTVSLNGKFEGTKADFLADANIRTSDGRIEVKASMNQKHNKTNYEADIRVHQMHIGRILKQDSIMGRVTLEAHAKGQGMTEKDINLVLTASVDSIYLNKYNFKKFKMNASMAGKRIEAHAKMDDPNLAFLLDGKVNMQKNNGKYQVNLDLKGANMLKLNLSDKDIQLSANINVDMTGDDVDHINGNAGIRNIIVYHGKKKYEVDSLLMMSVNKEGKNHFDMSSSIIKARFDGNISLSQLPAAITNHLNGYINIGNQDKNAQKTAKSNSQNFEFEININNSPLIYEVFVPGLETFNPGPIKGSFDSEARKLVFDAKIIEVNYAGNELKNLNFNVNSNPDRLEYSLKFDQFSNSAADITLEKTSLSGNAKNNNATIDFQILDKENKKKIAINSSLASLPDGVYRYKVNPDGFVLNNESWKLSPENYVEFGSKGLYINYLELSQKDQRFSFESSDRTENAYLNIEFEDFQLSSLSQIIEKGDSMARGKLDGPWRA